MLKKILVPLDGSAAAQFAIPWAATLAGKWGAELCLTRVFIQPMPYFGGEGIASGDPSIYEESKVVQKDAIEQQAQAVGQTYPSLQVSGTLIDGSESTAGVLANYAQEQQVDLTVMTTHGKGAFARFWLGSVADSYLKIATGKILLVRADPEQQPTGTPTIKHVVIPLDGSRFAEQALAPGFALAKEFQASVTLLLVLDSVEDIRGLIARINKPGLDLELIERALPAAKAYVQGVAEQHSHCGLPIEQRVLEHGTASAEILAQAGSPETLIALASHGHGGLSRMLFGSVADKVVRGAVGPVLIVRAADEE
ncbi:MAG: universal stress protein [Zavarzinella sp.]